MNGQAVFKGPAGRHSSSNRIGPYEDVAELYGVRVGSISRFLTRWRRTGSQVTARIWLIAVLLLGCCPAAGETLDRTPDRTPLASVELHNPAPKFGLAALPADAPRPVLYTVKNARAPSCGLLPSARAASQILPILEVGPDDLNFPFCEGINEAAPFEYRNSRGFVFRYVQRDTRQETSASYFYVLESGGDLQPLDNLIGEFPPEDRSIQYMAAWGKARLVRLENEKDAYRSSPSDSIVTESAFLDVSRNETAQSCRMVVDLVATQSSLQPVMVPCKAILASTAWNSGKAVYFIVLTDSAQNQAMGHVFVTDRKTAREDFEIESRLETEIRSRQILKVKAALRQLVGSR
jgi:hypothetical protein